MNESDVEYAGFWVRVGASMIDTVLMMVILVPLLLSVYGWEYFESESLIQGPADFLISWLLPAIAIVWFWAKRQATPGKSALSLRVVDGGRWHEYANDATSTHGQAPKREFSRQWQQQHAQGNTLSMPRLHGTMTLGSRTSRGTIAKLSRAIAGIRKLTFKRSIHERI